MNADDFDNYWVQAPEAVEASTEPALQIDTIDGVEPLDAQLGVADLKTVPDALYEPLFGQPSDALLHTYAILDAAKVPNLPELLETSGLKHRCLFKGDAYDELKDVAPWVVRLEDGNAFTRNLFTRSDAPWHLWDAEPGIYLRSSGTLDDMWKHFRKFTKVQDEQGKWFYFRFWEARTFTQILEKTEAAPLLSPPDGCVFYRFCVPTKNTTYVATLKNVSVDDVKPFKLTADYRMSFDASIEDRFARDYAVTLGRAAPVHTQVLGIEGHDALTQMVIRVTAYMKPLGFSKRSDLGRIASCALFYGTHFLHDPRIVGVSQSYLTDAKSMPGLRAKRFEDALRKALPLEAMAGVSGITRLLPHLHFVLGQENVTQEYLTKVYTPEFGFHDADTVQRFMQTCQSQQPTNVRDSFAHQAAHFILSALYTPYFLDDPLHTTLQSIFKRTGDFETHLFFEIERRITLLKES